MLRENTLLTPVDWDLSPIKSVLSGRPSPLALIRRFIGAQPTGCDCLLTGRRLICVRHWPELASTTLALFRLQTNCL
ncbi:hypothetical protein ELS82_22870 [Vibrio ouci]|uniref:Uncharacterized protein n=1 Tax=Vibrio ouci TaxID=2499078 RepID=A0A4Y8W921_9VIBR|nr:hypothetical protein ELS82_22870 [Vibrio ouci]